jgi:hypothetical protein
MKFERFHVDRTKPTGPDWIWVFGSNLGGRHGAGAALVALDSFGARLGVGEGPTGSSYAIPTKDAKLAILPFEAVTASVATFICYARRNPEKQFFVTRIGCELARFKDAQIGPLFADAPENCSLPEQWKEFVVQSVKKPN